MLKMRLQRIGRRNDASFRLIVTDSRRGPKSGKHIDLLGSYNPKLNKFTVDAKRAKDWISKGVQVSDTVHNLLVSHKVIEGKKVNVLPRKSPIISEEPEKEEAPADAPAGEEAEESTQESEETKAGKEVAEETAGEEKAEGKEETKAEEDKKEETDTDSKDANKEAEEKPEETEEEKKAA